MSLVLRWLTVLCCCLHLFGGHYGVLQGVAWAKMLIDYSAEDGLLVGAQKTFDGQHPCEMCKSIAAAKEVEQNDSPSAPPTNQLKDLGLKPTPIAPRLRIVFPSSLAASFQGYPDPADFLRTFCEQPPCPPPQALA